jgi:hypothetical protein
MTAYTTTFGVLLVSAGQRLGICRPLFMMVGLKFKNRHRRSSLAESEVLK